MDLSQYLAEDTICAAITPVGGPVAIVRVSGPGVRPAVKKMTQVPFEHGMARRVSIVDSLGDPIDQGVLVSFVGPRSFTGEDVAEFQVHGNPLVVERLLETCRSHSIRAALPGEFAYRAVKNGKISLHQALGIRDLLEARTQNGVLRGLEKTAGRLDASAEELRDSLLRVAALAEVGIDFSDQDAGEASLGALKRELKGPADRLRDLLATYGRGRVLREGVRVVIAGQPNVGKSSLFNALAGHSRAIVHDTPGTTRDVIEANLRLRTGDAVVPVELVDTAGMRESADPIERAGILKANAAVEAADVLVWCGSSGEGEVRPPAHPSLIKVHTKCDLGGQVREGALAVSVVSGQGLSILEAAIARAAASLPAPEGGLVLTRAEEYEAVELALAALERARGATALELVASDLRFCLKSLGPVIGGVGPEDVLGQVFSTFCIGK